MLGRMSDLGKTLQQGVKELGAQAIEEAREAVKEVTVVTVHLMSGPGQGLRPLKLTVPQLLSNAPQGKALARVAAAKAREQQVSYRSSHLCCPEG